MIPPGCPGATKTGTQCQLRAEPCASRYQSSSFEGRSPDFARDIAAVGCRPPLGMPTNRIHLSRANSIVSDNLAAVRGGLAFLRNCAAKPVYLRHLACEGS
jgi:hypothetical protein